MPLRQSTLNFSLRATSSSTTLPVMPTATVLRPAGSSPVDMDTIVVDTTDTIPQLPTPSESATDISSQGSQATVSKNVPRSRSKRAVSARGRKSAFQEAINDVEDEQNKNRSISGETLVAEEAPTKQADFLHAVNKALDDSWHSISVVGEETEQSFEQEADGDQSGDLITVREESEDETVSEERRAAKKAKMQENAKKWEERKKAAEKGATRRSGRASLMSKASEIIGNIKDTVLGKRSRDTSDKVVAEQETSGRHVATSSSLEQPLKRQRTDETEIADEPATKKLSTRREKKWLVSGLYAGQPRVFDARLTENKNKRKSHSLSDVQIKENTVISMPMFAGERLLQHGRDFKLPFDVFSPLPAGQPKPDEWKKVNKNVFVGDAAAEWRTSKFVEHSACSCNRETGCDQDCMNRYMYYECDSRNCNLSEEWCNNRAFEELKKRTRIGGKYNVGVEVIKTADRGYGVRSNRTFMPNQIIVEYTGEIITQEECEHRMRTIYKTNECYYLMLFDQNMIIDATRGSIARFVNHSCEPNCRMEKWTVGGQPRMALFAGDRGIMTGEELTYDYNFDPYSQKNVQACRCGAQNCRGILGPKPKPEAKRSSPENDKGKKKKEGKLSNAKRKVTEVFEESAHKVNKKRKVTPIKGKNKHSPNKNGAGNKSPKRVVLVKKSTARKVSVPKGTAKLGRSDSKLKKILTEAKTKAGSIKGRRVVSSSSATEALLGTRKSSVVVSRSSSLKEKAKSVTRSVRARSKTISAMY